MKIYILFKLNVFKLVSSQNPAIARYFTEQSNGVDKQSLVFERQEHLMFHPSYGRSV